MRHAERVTFGASGLDRAAHLRGDTEAQASHPAARWVPFWRGKPLMAPDAESGGFTLGAVVRGHPALVEAGQTLFLGLEGEAPRFAADLSDWTPEEIPETVGRFSDPSEQRHPALPGAAFRDLRGAMTRLSARDAELAATARGLLEWHRSHGFCANCGAPSEPAEAGWQRHCPACGRRHFPRTDPVVIMLVTAGNSVLVGRAPGWPERMYSLLAGFVEPGETIEAAVRRETLEETGVHVGRVRYLTSQPWPFPASLMIGCRGQAASTGIATDPVEIADARWMTREEMMAAFAGAHEVTPARPGAIARFLLREWLADRLD